MSLRQAGLGAANTTGHKQGLIVPGLQGRDALEVGGPASLSWEGPQANPARLNVAPQAHRYPASPVSASPSMPCGLMPRSLLEGKPSGLKMRSADYTTMMCSPIHYLRT